MPLLFFLQQSSKLTEQGVYWFVDKLRLSTIELEDEVICSPTLKLYCEWVLYTHFQKLCPEDNKFYKAYSVDIVFGFDIYSKIIVYGIFIRHELPTAQNTLSGLVLYGTFSN